MDRKKSSYFLILPMILCGIVCNLALSKLCLRLNLPLFLDCYGTVLITLLGGYLPGIIVGFMSNFINGMSDPITLYYGILSVMIALAVGLLGKKGYFDRFRRCILPILTLAFIGGALGSCLTWLLYGGGIGCGISAPYAIELLDAGLSEFWAQLLADVCIDVVDKVIVVLFAVFAVRLIPQKAFDSMPFALLGKNPVMIGKEEQKDYRVHSLRTKVTSILILNSLIVSGVAIAIGNYLYRAAILARYTDQRGLVQRELLETDLMIFNIKLASLLFGATVIIVMAVLIYCDSKIVAPINAMTRITEDLTFDDPQKREEGNRLLATTHIRTGDEIENLFQALFKMSRDTDEYVKRIRADAEYIAHLQSGIIMSFADMVENRDENTGEHIRRTSAYVQTIAETLLKGGKNSEILTEQYVHELGRSAPLHDVGKIKISDVILNKPGRLTKEEYDAMKTHTTAGREILERISENIGKADYLQIATEMATYHHEWWNGNGYPEGLSGEQIPLSARIMAIADVFDALVSKRSYKEPFGFDEAVRMIQEESGTHFDPEVVGAFVASQAEIRKINEGFDD